jgi:hypothetical protein
VRCVTVRWVRERFSDGDGDGDGEVVYFVRVLNAGGCL